MRSQPSDHKIITRAVPAGVTEDGGPTVLLMTSDRTLAMEPWMTDSLAAALVTVGCPVAKASALASVARIEWSEGRLGSDGEWLLVLHGCGAGLGDPVHREEWDSAAEQVARSVADDNAEANDRLTRGETKWKPIWLLSDRPARRS